MQKGKPENREFQVQYIITPRISEIQFILFIQSQASARYHQFPHCKNPTARQWRGAPSPWKRGSTQKLSTGISRKTKDQCKSSYTSQVAELP